MGAFEQVVKTMIEMDVFQLFFPWMLVFAVTYGVLKKYDFFDDESITGVVALSVSFISIGGIYLVIPQGLFTSFAAALAFAVFGLLGLIIMLSLAGVDISEWESPMDETPAKLGMSMIIIAFIGVLVYNVDILGLLGASSSTQSFQEVVMPIIILIFLGLMVGATVRGGDSGSDD